MVKLGDFSSVAKYYAESRPDYSSEVLNKIIKLLPKNISEVVVADVGAGTGIWTDMIAKLEPKLTYAVEPNDEMRAQGQIFASNKKIKWLSGSAEDIPLADNTCDWVTMASSFHWANFDQATKEFFRILRPGGMFTALWNPRKIDTHPLLIEIENYAKSLKPDLNRVSSGLSKNNENIATALKYLPFFEDLTYFEGTHSLTLSRDRYITIWKSVNDLQAQLGQNRFKEFIDFVELKTASLKTIDVSYLTRAWTIRKLR